MKIKSVFALGLGLLIILGCNPSSIQPDKTGLAGQYVYVRPDSSQAILYWFRGDSVSTEKQDIENGCILSWTEGTFTLTKDSLCFVETIFQIRTSCDEELSNWLPGEKVCTTIRGLTSMKFEVKQPEPDSSGLEMWIIFKLKNK